MRYSVLRGDRLHLEVVAQDDAGILQLVAQDVRHDTARQGGRLLFVERRNEHVRRHDRRDAGLDRRVEGDELRFAEPLRRMLDQRQLVMRIGDRVAVTRKVLAAGGDAFALQRSDDRRAESRDVGRLVAERAVADHGVLRVREDVEHGRVVEGYADSLQLRGERLRESLGERDVPAAAQRRHRRPLGERRLEPRHAAAFLID